MFLILDTLAEGTDFRSVGKLKCSGRFHRLAWGQPQSYGLGLIAGGCDNGTVSVYDPEKLIAGEDAEVCSLTKHQGDVRALDFNAFSRNMLASGGDDGEIYVWDLEDPKAHKFYSPGKRAAQAPSEVTSVAWNNKVQYILASTYASGHAAVWDLRVKKTLLTFADKSSRKLKDSAWNLGATTQLVTVAEDSGAVQLWDLRNAISPVLTFAGHKGGAWSVSWSPFDTEYFATAGRDKTVVWSATRGTAVCEVSGGDDWSFHVEWSPVAPALLSECTNAGKMTVRTFHDFSEQQPRPPRWLPRKSGTAFGFGGKRVTFNEQGLSVASTTPDASLLSHSEAVKRVTSEKLSATALEELGAQSQEKQFWNLLASLESNGKAGLVSSFFGFSFDEGSYRTEPSATDDGSTTEATEDEVSIDLTNDTKTLQGLLTNALIFGKTEEACRFLIAHHRPCEAMLLAKRCSAECSATVEAQYRASLVKGAEETVGERLELTQGFRALFVLYLDEKYDEIVRRADLNQWQQVLCLLLARGFEEKEFSRLATALGHRLQSGNPSAAAVCFTLAANIEEALTLWEQECSGDLVQPLLRVCVARSVLGLQSTPPGERVAHAITKHASLLVNGSALQQAADELNMFGLSFETLPQETLELIDRIAHSIPLKFEAKFPFTKVEVGPKSANAAPRRATSGMRTQPQPTGTALPTISNSASQQTSPSQPFIPSIPMIPKPATVPTQQVPNTPAIPMIPKPATVPAQQVPNVPTIPMIPKPAAIPAQQAPNIPSIPMIPKPATVPAQQVPNIPTIPMIPTPSTSTAAPVQPTASSQPFIPALSNQQAPAAQPFIPAMNSQQAQPFIPAMNTQQAQPFIPAMNTQQAQPNKPFIPAMNGAQAPAGQPFIPAMPSVLPGAQPTIPQGFSEPLVEKSAVERAAPIKLERTEIKEKEATAEEKSALEAFVAQTIPKIAEKLQGTPDATLIEDAAKRLGDIAKINLSASVADLIVQFAAALNTHDAAEQERLVNELAKHGHELSMSRVIGLKKLKLAAQKTE